jgi:transposase-like protein/IS1 family transposase
MDMNLVKLIEQFRSDDACREYLQDIRWPDGVTCPKCGHTGISRIHKRNQFDCNSCRYQFSVTAGTIFHDSHLPLWKWFMAIYLVIESKKGISANQLKRMINVSYKTAWYLCHRIRATMKNGDAELLKGIVEVDETFIGGKRKGVGSGNRDGKAMVVGAVERDGKAILQVIRSNDRKTLHEFIKKNTAPNTKAIYTDDWPAYRGIADEDTDHMTVNHEWVRGDVHTGTIDNVWGLLKRSIVGSYHKISIKHLDAYLDELEWRYGNRKNPWLFRDTLQKLLSSGALEYKELTA